MNNLIPQGFLYTKASAIEAKIIGFKQAGVSQLQVVLDFDRTLTVGVTKNREDSSSWQILKDHLQPEARQKVHAPFDYYRAKEVAGTLTIQEATDWWSHSLDLMQEYRLDLASVEKDFMSKSTIRPGAKELFELCALHNIPTIILSAGVKEVIDIWTKAYDIHPTMILATELELDENKRMIGWKK
jgi:phosphoserine phosphatase